MTVDFYPVDQISYCIVFVRWPEILFFKLLVLIWLSPHSVVVNALDCDVLVSKFELLSCYYIHFWTNALKKVMTPPSPPVMGQTVPLLSFYKDGSGI